MAEVAAAVANGGKLMRPHIGDRFVDADGRTTKTIDDRDAVDGDERADRRRGDRHDGVGGREGHGHEGADRRASTVAGKTGTAETETGAGQKNNLWFIGFAPADDPQVAVAVTVKDVVGFGGDVAAPIAKAADARSC